MGSYVDGHTTIFFTAEVAISSAPPPSTTSSPFGPLTLPSSSPPSDIPYTDGPGLFLIAQMSLIPIFTFLTLFQLVFSLFLYRRLNLHRSSIHQSIPNSLLFTCSFGFVSKLLTTLPMWMQGSNEFRGKVCGLVGEGLAWFWKVGEVLLVYYFLKEFTGRVVDRQRSSWSSGSTLRNDSLSEPTKRRRTGFQKTFRIYGSIWILVSLVTLGVRFPWFDVTTGVMNTPYGGFPRSISPTIFLRVMLYLNVLASVMVSGYLTFKTKGVWFGEGRYPSGSRMNVPKPLLFLAPLLLLRYVYEVLQLIVLSFLWEPEGTLPIGRGDEWVTASIIVLGSLDFLIVSLAISVARRMVLDRTNANGRGDIGVGIDGSDFTMKPVRLHSRDDRTSTKWGKSERDMVPYTI
ncbi:hypothetical protein BDN72DRAFT_838203 [Pluteus cervinus]|uniref:Uncharacterized protein n=1 Tax=Pluteus cervinus TaxID=181527 RepID=A0ACD3B0H1_9AGAR|nr:hypothetical protein BDN72DRAFT_838203 [Pluteus cervinus]